MSNRDFGVVLLGRFLVVERYRETRVVLDPPTAQPRPGSDRRRRRQAGLEQRLPGTGPAAQG